MRVVHQRVPGAPVAAIHLWIDVGSSQENPGEFGAAHFLEHMVFKSTERFGVGEVAAAVEELGGDLNAWTSPDSTVLHATVLTDGWSKALGVIGEMALHARLDRKEFEPERGVIVEEVRSYAADPDTVVGELVNEGLFLDHPYGRPITGTEEHVNALTVEHLAEFRQRCWSPAQATLVIVGDLDEDRVTHRAHELFGDWAHVPSPDAPALPSRPRAGVQQTNQFDTRLVEIGWPGPPIGHPDGPALEVLAAWLGGGGGAELVRELQLTDSLASDPWADASPHRFGGSFSIGFRPRARGFDAAIERTLAVVERIRRGGGSGRAVLRARDALVADHLFDTETVGSIATNLGWYAVRYGDLGQWEANRQRVAGCTPDMVADVAERWLQPDKAVVVASLAGDSLNQRTIRPRPANVSLDRTFDNGARLLLLPDQREVAAVRLATLGGGLLVPARRAGLHAAWGSTVLTGCGAKDAVQFGEEVDALAGTLNSSVTRDAMGFHGTFPSYHLLDGLGLLDEAVTDPQFDPEEWQRVREEMLDDIETIGDRPSEVAVDRARKHLWHGHPWRLPTLGTEASLNAIRPATLRAFHDTAFTGHGTVMVVAGGFDPAAVSEAACWLGSLPPGKDLPPRTPPMPRLGTRCQVQAGREQATLILCGLGHAVDDPDRDALLMASNMLSAQGGRLFRELREERGLAYSVWAASWSGIDGGSFTAGVVTDPARVEEAAAAMITELHRFAKAGPQPEELHRSRQAMLGAAAADLQGVSSLAADACSAAILGLESGFDALRRRMESITVDQTRQAIERVVDAGFVRVRVDPRP